jgi:hypothetical protein
MYCPGKYRYNNVSIHLQFLCTFFRRLPFKKANPDPILDRIRKSANQAIKRYRCSWSFLCRYQCCGSGMFIPNPGSEFFPSRIQGQKDSGSQIRIRIKEFK